MKNVIIGTAGHIDHGKTTLIKAITGRETDRLREERERGISIDLGFTYFDLPSGRRAGIVDVPGHEKFIKNMLAGVGGIDIVILVVAADEGFMPQTQEHLNILSLLEVKRGIIALTKGDMVDKEWLEMVTEEVQESVKGTFLEHAPIIPVSSPKGMGIDRLIQQIDKLTTEIEEKDITKPFRLPIDRAFTITGFGTVVTGTMIEGRLKEGDSVALYPSGLETKVRSIQVHEDRVEIAEAGQRVAVNISNIKKEQVNRGDVLAPPDTMHTTMMLDVKIKMLKDSPFSIRNRERIRLYHGTSEVLGRVVLLDQEELLPEQEGYAQLRLESHIAAKNRDHFIIRFYSPMVTIGGGIILDAYPPKRKRFKKEIIEELQLKEKGSLKDILLQFLKIHSKDFFTLTEIEKRIGAVPQELGREMECLVEEHRLIKITIGEEIYLFHPEFIDNIVNNIKNLLQKFHKEHPLKRGMSKEEIRSRIFKDKKTKVVDELLHYFEKDNIIKNTQGVFALGDFTIELTKLQQSISKEIEERFKKDAVNPPRPEEIWINKGKEQEVYQQVFEALVQWGTIVKISEEIYFHQDSLNQIIEKLRQYLAIHPDINIAAFRDLLGTSRKYAIALLENFDQKKITKRMGDVRVLY